MSFAQDLLASDAVAQLSEYLGESDDGIGSSFPAVKGFKGKIKFLDPPDRSRDKMIIVGILHGRIVFKYLLQVDAKGHWHIIEHILWSEKKQTYEYDVVYDKNYKSLDALLLLKMFFASYELLHQTFPLLNDFKEHVRFIRAELVNEKKRFVIGEILNGKAVFKYVVENDTPQSLVVIESQQVQMSS